jgi:PST family polysaccharide transporter
MLRAGILSAAVSVVAIIAGLPWGAAGVAMAYGVSELCVATPIIFWIASHKGPIKIADFYRTIAPAACASLCGLVVVLLSRQWLMDFYLPLRVARRDVTRDAGAEFGPPDHRESHPEQTQ